MLLESGERKESCERKLETFDQIFFQFLCLVFIVVKVIIIGPLLLKSEAADQFIQAFERISSDFHTLQSNSRDYNDCSMILWTKSHESKYEEIGNISVAALGSTSFNRFEMDTRL